MEETEVNSGLLRQERGCNGSCLDRSDDRNRHRRGMPIAMDDHGDGSSISKIENRESPVGCQGV